MEKSICYEALRSHDTRFDGKFFVAVSSTGIYCRPVCRVRLPKEDNCTFYRTAAEAERAGYRPCLKCRPELAPGNSLLEASADLAREAAAIIEENCGNDESLAELAARLGCTDRHLRRVFEAEFHVTPLQYRQTCRLLLAKNLLTDTRLSVLEVAMASGFGSLRRFNAVFEKEYRLTPTALRKQYEKQERSQNGFTVEIGYRPPYEWERMLTFLSARAIGGVELVRDGCYWRTVHIKDSTGWIKVENRPARNALAVTLSDSLVRVLPQVLARARRLFDTACDPWQISQALGNLRELDERLPVCGIRVPGCFEPFETAARAILGQQISVRAATTLAGRVAESFGTAVETGVEGLTYRFPTAEQVSKLENIEERFGELGVIAARSRTIQSLAALFSEKELREISKEDLLTIKGIGPWSAEYIAMRVVGDTDAFMPGDLGIRKALAPRTQKEIETCSEAWRPWRAYAALNLWTL